MELGDKLETVGAPLSVASVTSGSTRACSDYALTGEGDWCSSIRWKLTGKNSGLATFEKCDGTCPGATNSQADAHTLCRQYFGTDMASFDLPDQTFCRWTRKVLSA